MFQSEQGCHVEQDSVNPVTDDLVISIINYKTAQLTISCLQSVLADMSDTGTLSIHVVIVDNASGDGSPEIIEKWIADQDIAAAVTLIRSAVNGGFSAGHNQGIAARAGNFYLLLNSDAVLRPGFCRAMLAAAHTSPEGGLFAPRIDYDDGGQQVSLFRTPTPASELIRAAATAQVTQVLQRYDVPLDMPPEPNQIGWASFAGIVLRATMIDAIGDMDEGYFLYFEDTEYCLRARRAGWLIVYAPEARMVHFRGGSAPVKALAKAGKRLPAYYYASRTRLFYQAHGRTGLIAANLMWILGRSLAALRPLLGKPKTQASAHEARDIWTNIMHPTRRSDRSGS
jgi:hypothetical protein